MRNPKKSSRSLFAAALARLLDDTNLYSRSGWAGYLRIKPPAISQWLYDKTIPRPDILYTIWKTLEISSDIPAEPLRVFREMAERPAEEVSPLGIRMQPNVWQYMTRPAAESIAGSLRGMSRNERRVLAEEGSYLPAVEMISERPPRKHGEWLGWAMIPIPRNADFDPTLLPRLHPLSEEQETRPSVDWRELSDARRACIWGGAGAGKSAMLQHLFAWHTRESETSAVLLRPVTAEQKREELQLLDLQNPPFMPEVVMFDGLDELPPELRPSATADITTMENDRPNLRFIVASRPNECVRRDLAHFPAYTLASLTRQQITLWVHQSLTRNEVIRTEFDDYIVRLLERENLQSAFARPLFLFLALRLFKHHGTTAFADAEIVMGYVDFVLGDWERSKNVSRTREPWASPQNLRHVLGYLSYKLAGRELRSFDLRDFEAWISDFGFRDVQAGSMLEVLSDRSGFVRKRDDGTWEAADESFVDYLAAYHLVNSTENTLRILFTWPNDRRCREVLRLACSLTGDATPIMRLISKEQRMSDADKALTFASVLAQPLRADEKVLASACDDVVGWLDGMLEPWQVTAPERDADPQEHLWTLRARCEQYRSDASRAWQVLPHIHQARSGPAGELLTERLAHAGAPVLRAVKDSLDVDGKLVLVPRPDYTDVRAHVYAP